MAPNREAMNSVALPAGSPGQSAVVRRRRDLHVRLAIVRAVFGVIPAFSLSRCRMLALRACGVRTGRSTWFWGMPLLTGPGRIAARLQVGSDCGFNDGCEFDLAATITIGNHVAVGHEVRFLTTRVEEGRVTETPITVGDGVWIGARCTIEGGVTIGPGSVIGAGVTVSSDVPANTMLTGDKAVSLARWR